MLETAGLRNDYPIIVFRFLKYTQDYPNLIWIWASSNFQTAKCCWFFRPLHDTSDSHLGATSESALEIPATDPAVLKNAITNTAEDLCRQLQDRLEGLSRMGGKLQEQNQRKLSSFISRVCERVLRSSFKTSQSPVICQFLHDDLTKHERQMPLLLQPPNQPSTLDGYCHTIDTSPVTHSSIPILSWC